MQLCSSIYHSEVSSNEWIKSCVITGVPAAPLVVPAFSVEPPANLAYYTYEGADASGCIFDMVTVERRALLRHLRPVGRRARGRRDPLVVG